MPNTFQALTLQIHHAYVIGHVSITMDLLIGLMFRSGAAGLNLLLLHFPPLRSLSSMIYARPFAFHSTQDFMIFLLINCPDSQSHFQIGMVAFEKGAECSEYHCVIFS